MYKKLHIQLTVFCALIISVILFSMSFFCIHLSRENEISNRFSEFQSQTGQILWELETADSISHTWLGKLSEQYQLLFHILDNGQPLLYQTSAAASSEESLFQAAIDLAEADYALSEASVRGRQYAQHTEFCTEELNGRTAFISVCYLPKGNNVLTIVILSFLTIGPQFTTNIVLPFLSLAIAVIVLLCAASCALIRRLIRPLEDSHRAQTDFFASASHELRSPLTVIAAALSAAQTAPRERQVQLLGTAEKEAGRMKRLINDMFTLACLDYGSVSIERTDVQLENLLIEAYEKFLPVFSEKRIGIQFQLPDTLLPSCRCDPERIRQLLSILLDNAASYTPPGGSIRIGLRLENGQFFITVADSGPGIPDAEKEAVFRRFYRCDKSRTNKKHFGLGLSIAKEITALHHGRLLVSDAPEGGAVFSILLPVR